MKVGRGRGLTASPIDTYGHFKSLDGLRAFAIVVVMVFHLDEKEGLPGWLYWRRRLSPKVWRISARRFSPKSPHE
jgi:peptidoglycan/LPS O-acetylase OafA/YrhL